jgi:hypothetical protein
LPCEEEADTAAADGDPKPPVAGVVFLSVLLLPELLRTFLAKSKVAKEGLVATREPVAGALLGLLLLPRDVEGSKRNEAVESSSPLTMR